MTAVQGTATVAVIPARYASTRLPGKPLADIAGMPMIRHVVERVSKATRVQAVFVATDDERIAAVVAGFGGHAIMTPQNLRSGTDRVAFAAQSLPHAEIIVNVQGDEPLISPGMIDEAIAPLTGDSTIDAGTLVKPLTDPGDLLDPGIVKVVLDREGNCLYFSRSPIPHLRDRPPGEWIGRHQYYKHIGLYVFRRAFLLRFAALPQTPLERAECLEQLRILEHGYRIRAAITLHDSTPVDTPADLEKVRTLIRERA